MIKVNVDQTITPELVEQLINKYKTSDICIVIKNTKKQSVNNLEKIAKRYSNYSNITISVTGGLDPKKNKFNDEYYQKRTYYNPMELCRILEFFNSIERKINISWTDTQKAMYIYQEICNSMEYEELEVGRRDVSRNLIGVMYGKAVCSGFAMIFKEALDRIGIQNEYQNQKGSHSWNVAFIDNNYRAFDLTWDCYNKDKNGCSFRYFNRDPDFYKNEYHDVSLEKEEIEYSIVPYTTEELQKNYRRINNRVDSIHLEDKGEIPITIVGKKYIIKNDEGDVKVIGEDTKTFDRKNGSKLIIINAGSYNGLYKYLCLEFPTTNELKLSRIYSETQLHKVDEEYDSLIANGLLSKERLDRKVNQFNGYVGYIGNNNKIYYNGDFEKEVLNVIR